LQEALSGITFAAGVPPALQSELAPQLRSYQEFLRSLVARS